MELRLDGKTAVITGGTTGIGLALAKELGLAGAAIAVCSRRQALVEETRKALSEQGIRNYGKSVDVADKKALFNFADNVEKELGGIDIWISNAGVYPQYKIIDTPEDIWNQVMDTNLKAVYYGALIAADKIRQRGGGVLINAASFASLMPSVGSGVYAASKAAVYSMTKTLAAELAPYNIRVNGFIPGVVDTEMTAPLIRENKEALESQVALNRIGRSEEVAKAVLFLVSDAASYITGTFIEVSGGKLAVQNPHKAWLTS